MIKQIGISLLISLLIVTITWGVLFHIAGTQAAKIAKSTNFKISLSDGEYQGSYYAFKKIPAAKIRFAIKNNTLVNFYIIDVITVMHPNVKTNMNKAIYNYGLDFDAISGATISSRFVQAAIADAIKK